MDFFRLLYLVSILLFFSCGNNTAKSIQQQEISQEFDVFANECIKFDIESLKVNALPFVDSTSFDNFSFENKLNQVQIQKLKLDERFGSVSVFYLNYRIELSENFISLVVSYERGEHELFTILVNYDRDYRIIDALYIAYHEIAESWFRKIGTIHTDKIIVEKFNYMDYYIEGEIMSETFVYKIDTGGRFFKYQHYID